MYRVLAGPSRLLPARKKLWKSICSTHSKHLAPSIHTLQVRRSTPVRQRRGVRGLATERPERVGSREESTYVKLEAPGNPLHGVSIDALYLRDSCACPRCVEPSTRQKLFETSSLPRNIAARDLEWLPDGSLEILWENDFEGFGTHRSVFSRNFLKQTQSLEDRRRASFNSWDHVAWDRTALERRLSALYFQYTDYVEDDTILQKSVECLHVYGLAFVKQVPGDENAVRRIAERIGPLKHTFYGETWDVKSKPMPTNVAYTAGDLDFHMDLLYMADPPSVQLLHCIKQSTKGGESRFSDGVRAFDRMQAEHPELVRPLVDFPVTFHYKNDGHWFQQTRGFIEGGTAAKGHPEEQPGMPRKYRYPVDYEAMNWSPPFQGPFEQVDPRGSSEHGISVGEYVKAANTFKKLLADDSAVFETKMEQGTCVIFNNRRVLHARRPFSSEGGERWLKGCYIDGDYLRDRFRVLSERSSSAA